MRALPTYDEALANAARWALEADGPSQGIDASSACSLSALAWTALARELREASRAPVRVYRMSEMQYSAVFDSTNDAGDSVPRPLMYSDHSRTSDCCSDRCGPWMCSRAGGHDGLHEAGSDDGACARWP